MKSIIWFLIVFLLFISGCGEYNIADLEPSEELCLQQTNAEQIVQATNEVLTRMHFAIEKSDFQQGYVRSGWLRSSQVFEFWRSDVKGAYNLAESNLHSLEKSVTLIVDTIGGETCIRCEVRVRRLSIPEKLIGSSARAAGAFTGGSRSIQNLTLSGPQREEMAWIDLGNDSKLEKEILDRIKARLLLQEEKK